MEQEEHWWKGASVSQKRKNRKAEKLKSRKEEKQRNRKSRKAEQSSRNPQAKGQTKRKTKDKKKQKKKLCLRMADEVMLRLCDDAICLAKSAHSPNSVFQCFSLFPTHRNTQMLSQKGSRADSFGHVSTASSGGSETLSAVFEPGGVAWSLDGCTSWASIHFVSSQN